MALGWIDLAITAVTTGISIFQGFKAKKKQEAAIKKAQEEAYLKWRKEYDRQVLENNEKLIAVLLEQENEDALEAKKQKIIKIISFASAAFFGYKLLKNFTNRKEKKKKK